MSDSFVMRRAAALSASLLLLSLSTWGCGPTAPSAEDSAQAPRSGPSAGQVATPTYADGETGGVAAAESVGESGDAAVGESVGEIVDRLRGLPFDDFLAQSHDALLSRSPEQVTELGRAGELSMRNDRLDDLSAAYQADTRALETAVLQLLRDHDRDGLTPDRQLSYDIYEWYLDDAVRGHAFAEHDYPINHCRTGHHYQLNRLLTTLHPLDTPQDARDYVARLEQVHEQVGQVLDGARRREEAGVVPPRFIVEKTQTVLTDYLGTDSREPEDVDVTSLPVYARFDDRLDEIEGLTDPERADLREQARQAIETSFVPAYMDQLAYLDELADRATDDAGVGRLTDGEAYYAYLLRSNTTTDITPAEAHELGLREVARIDAELRAALAGLGYPTDLPLPELVGSAVEDAGFLPLESQVDRDAVIQTWEGLIDEADQRVGEAFDLRPTAAVAVAGGSGGEYYKPSAPDGSQPCEFHVGLTAPSQPRYVMATIAHHEAVPGHHFQVGLARELDLPQVRNDLRFEAFAEGWAVYAEKLTWELGAFDDDPYGNVGRLLCELLRAARLVVDTGIHAEGWTRDEARAYMDETAGAAPGTFDWEVDRIVVAPAEATANEVGLREILEMRQRAQTALGDDFELKAFHNAIIGNGGMPLGILSGLVDDYIEAGLAARE
ncbi:MAG: DUF885 domain-containing protein [Anaerolineae bacterium]